MSNKKNNQLNVPQAREAGSVGIQMVKNNCPIQTMKFQRHNRIAMGHVQTEQYIGRITA